jgi:cell division protein FtsQ
VLRAALVVTAQFGVLVAVLAWGVPAARTYVRAHPYFAVRDVVIEHRGRVPAATLRAQAGVSAGMSVWDVDAAAVERRLRALPWVRSARVQRELPNRVVLRVREHRPAAILRVAGADGGLFYVAAGGEVFAAVGAHDGRDLPYLSGLSEEDLGSSGLARDAIRGALDVVRAAERHRTALGVVSEVHVDRDRGLTLLPVRPAIPIQVGWGDYDGKLARVAEVLPHWTGREDEVRSVSGFFADTVVVKLRAVPREWGA